MLVNIFYQKKYYVSLKKYAYRIINTATDPVILTKLGVFLAQINEPAIALDSFEKAIRLVPNDKEAYFAAAKFFSKLGKHDEAAYLGKIGLSIASSEQGFK